MRGCSVLEKSTPWWLNFFQATARVPMSMQTHLRKMIGMQCGNFVCFISTCFVTISECLLMIGKYFVGILHRREKSSGKTLLYCVFAWVNTTYIEKNFCVKKLEAFS